MRRHWWDSVWYIVVLLGMTVMVLSLLVSQFHAALAVYLIGCGVLVSTLAIPRYRPPRLRPSVFSRVQFSLPGLFMAILVAAIMASHFGREVQQAERVRSQIRRIELEGGRVDMLDRALIHDQPIGVSLDGNRINDQHLLLLAELKTISRLSLRHTRITNEGLRSIGILTNLKTLNLAQTQISNEGLSYLVPLRALVRLDLSGTRVGCGCVQHLSQLPSLRNLNLSSTRVSNLDLSDLPAVSELARLNLSRTDITDEGIEKLAELSGFHQLDLSHTQITDDSLPGLGRLKIYDRLILTGTKIGDLGIDELRLKVGGQVVF